MKTRQYTKTGITRLSLAAALTLLFVLGNTPTAEAGNASGRVTSESSKRTRTTRDQARRTRNSRTRREPAQTGSSNSRNERRDAAQETIKRRAKEREETRRSRERRGQRHSHLDASGYRHNHRRGLQRSTHRDENRRSQHVVYSGQSYAWIWVSGSWFNNYWHAGSWQLEHCPHHGRRR